MKIKISAALALFTLLTFSSADRAHAQESSPSKGRQIAVNVFGEVSQPGRYLLPEGSTALDALGAASGQKPEANLKAVKLIHATTGEQPSTEVIDIKAVLAGTKVAPVLRAGDSLSFPRAFISVTY